MNWLLLSIFICDVVAIILYCIAYDLHYRNNAALTHGSEYLDDDMAKRMRTYRDVGMLFNAVVIILSCFLFKDFGFAPCFLSAFGHIFLGAVAFIIYLIFDMFAMLLHYLKKTYF